MKRILTAAIALMSLSSFASAAEFSCGMAKAGTGGWIRPVIQVKIDPSTNEAWVRDDLTNRSVQGWYDAKLKVNNDKRYTVTWTYKDLTKDKKNQSAPSLDYRLTIVKSTLKANATMDPRGFNNRWTGRGKCKQVKS